MQTILRQFRMLWEIRCLSNLLNIEKKNTMVKHSNASPEKRNIKNTIRLYFEQVFDHQILSRARKKKKRRRKVPDLDRKADFTGVKERLIQSQPLKVVL